MHLLKGILIAAIVAVLAVPSWALTDRQVKEAVEDELGRGPDRRTIVLVALRSWCASTDARCSSLWNRRTRQGDHLDTLFNLASLGKTFDVTLLSMAVLQGELRLTIRSEKYVPELQDCRDVRNIRLDHLVSYTSGLSCRRTCRPGRTPSTDLPKFMQYLKTWKLPEDHEAGKD